MSFKLPVNSSRRRLQRRFVYKNLFTLQYNYVRMSISNHVMGGVVINMKKRMIIGASLGNCVHVAGVAHFLALAEDEGYEALFLGPAVNAETIIHTIQTHKPEMVAGFI